MRPETIHSLFGKHRLDDVRGRWCLVAPGIGVVRGTLCATHQKCKVLASDRVANGEAFEDERPMRVEHAIADLISAQPAVRRYCWRVGGPVALAVGEKCTECGSVKHDALPDQSQCGKFVPVTHDAGELCVLIAGHSGECTVTPQDSAQPAATPPAAERDTPPPVQDAPAGGGSLLPVPYELQLIADVRRDVEHCGLSNALRSRSALGNLDKLEELMRRLLTDAEQREERHAQELAALRTQLEQRDIAIIAGRTALDSLCDEIKETNRVLAVFLEGKR